SGPTRSTEEPRHCAGFFLARDKRKAESEDTGCRYHVASRHAPAKPVTSALAIANSIGFGAGALPFR
ncbi:MAG: hypothetical protein ACOCPR_04185, partial [Guyparkeria sp.]